MVPGASVHPSLEKSIRHSWATLGAAIRNRRYELGLSQEELAWRAGLNRTYLRTRPPEGKERLVGADASHAWYAVFCPGVGWVDFDPTNNVQPGEEHITVATGRDFADVSPVSGIITGGGAHQVKVSPDITPF